MHEVSVHGTWSSRVVFLLAAVGAAVGLGNMWKFPYTAGVSGGGAFVLIYLICIVAVAIPVVMAELLIGRRGRQSPVNSMRTVSVAAGASANWRYVGWMNITAAFLIVSFYSVIAGWALAYIPKFASGLFANQPSAAISAEFDKLLASPVELTAWHAIFMAMTVFIVGQGIHKGIERAVKFLMPSLFLMLLLLVAYAAIEGDFAAGARFLFHVDFSKVSAEVVLNAIGQAFFSVSVAMGLMMTYGAYLPENVWIPRAAIIIAAADTLVALLAGLAIFPIVFANGLDPAEGAGLVFRTLPIAFGAMPGGSLFGTVFFVLLVFAALTSSIALLEPIVAWAEEHKGVKRLFSAVATGAGAWLLGLATVLSFNVWGKIHPLDAFETFRGKTIFDLIDYFASNILLPLGGILIALFAAWIMSSDDTRQELNLEDRAFYRSWRLLARYLAPVAIGAVLVFNLT